MSEPLGTHRRGARRRAGPRALLICLSAAVALSFTPSSLAQHPGHKRGGDGHAASRQAALLQTSPSPGDVDALPGVFVDGFQPPDEAQSSNTGVRGRLAKAGVNVGEMPVGSGGVGIGKQGPEGGIPGVFFPPFSKADSPPAQTKSMREPQTVEEQAVYNAADKAERSAKAAEEQSKQLRESMEDKVGALQRQIGEMRERLANSANLLTQQTTVTVSPLAPRRARASARFSAAPTLSAPPGQHALAEAKQRLKIKRALSRVIKTASQPAEAPAQIALPPGMEAGGAEGGAGRAEKYPVVSVSDDGTEVVVAVENGVFAVGPARLSLVLADGGEQVIYTPTPKLETIKPQPSTLHPAP